MPWIYNRSEYGVDDAMEMALAMYDNGDIDDVRDDCLESLGACTVYAEMHEDADRFEMMLRDTTVDCFLEKEVPMTGGSDVRGAMWMEPPKRLVFEMRIDSRNEGVQDVEGLVLCLSRVIDKIKDFGARRGTVIDVNGNPVGEWAAEWRDEE